MTNTIENITLENTINTQETVAPLMVLQGFEMEIGEEDSSNNISVSKCQQILRRENFRHCFATNDGSQNVKAEIVFVPLIMTENAIKEYIKPVQQVFENEGARIRFNCGGHVHVGLKPVINMTVQECNRIQIEHWRNKTSPSLCSINGSYVSPLITLGEEMPFTLIKDAIKTYGMNQNYISTMLPESRRQHRWAYPIDGLMGNSFDNARSISALSNLGFTKQMAVNVLPYSTKGTIEFRQGASTLNQIKLARWCEFLRHLFNSSSSHRIDWNSSNNPTIETIETSTPYSHGSNGSFINKVYDMCRNGNNGFGATIEEIMNATNCGDQNVRSRISEFRRVYGQGAIVTHT